MPEIPSTTDDSVLRMVRNQTAYIEWDIHILFHKTYERDHCFESPTFSLFDAEWCIQLYPDYNNFVYLDLVKKKSPKDVHVSMVIGIKKGKDSAFKFFYTNQIFKKNECAWKPSRLLTSDLLQCKDAVAPKGVLTIFLMACNLDGSTEDVAAEAACHSPSDGFETLSKDFKELFLSRSKGDVSFKVRNRDFLAHKLVLSTRSTVFQRMFETDMVENNNGSIDILDSDPDHFEKFLLYLYSGDSKVVSSSNVLGLYMLADKYNLLELKKICSELLANEITTDSFCDIAVLAHLHDETKVLKAATVFFIEHADVILTTPKWAALNADHFTLANEFMIKIVNNFLKR